MSLQPWLDALEGKTALIKMYETVITKTLRKLVYVNPYVKGPDEMPLREARPTVFAVMR